MSTILLNAIPIMAGGGLQKALSLVRCVADDPNPRRFHFLATANSPIAHLAKTLGVSTTLVRGRGIARLWGEIRVVQKYPKGTLCFTVSGPVPIFSAGRFLNVAECAYSNLFYPEIPFWGFLPLPRRMAKEAIDDYRRWGVAGADAWIFQTPTIADRAVRFYEFPKERCHYVAPACGSEVASAPPTQAEFGSKEQTFPDGFRLLFLASPHPNKRIVEFAEFARPLLQARKICLLTTLPPDSHYSRRVLEIAGNQVLNFGTLKPYEVPAAIGMADAVCNFSVLESFSNNFIEAWTMRKPLVVADSEWARDICGPAAFYARFSSDALLTDLERLIREPSLLAAGVEAGRRKLLEFNTYTSRFDCYMTILDSTRSLGALPPASRHALRKKFRRGSGPGFGEVRYE